jgi:serine protease Do
METEVKYDRFWKTLSIMLFVVLAGATSYLVWLNQQPRHVYYERNSPRAVQPVSELVALSPGLEVDHDSIYWVADLAEQALPFVVNVETVINLPGENSSNESAEDFMREWQDNMPEFFPDFNMEERQMPQNHPPLGGEGSGFIIREDGYVVTNAHVVQGADSFLVHMYDGTTLDAELIGTDTFKDIAVLKVDSNDLSVAILGDSDATRIGEPVVAIGSPLGFEATVTAGIVSAANRSLEDMGRPTDIRRPQGYIQTDAAINRGNSGGPLLNAEGEVIGVNQAIVRWEGSMMGFEMAVPVEGIGFAIPINAVKDTIEQIVTNGKVVYPGISAQIVGLHDYLEREPNLELDVDQGVYVAVVTVGGPADRAGIEAGDVILTINDVEVTTAEELIVAIQDYSVGERVTLKVARQGTDKHENITVVLGELDLSGVDIR